MKLSNSFFKRSADVVAKELLGKILVRIIDGKELRAKIVETEAYFGREDSSSWQSGKKLSIFNAFCGAPGKILVYNVHKYIMFCIVTGRKNKPEAILIRALEPVNYDLRCSGPGLLSDALKIDRSFKKKDISNLDELFIEDSLKGDFEIINTTRVGVKEETPLNLRFYIKDNRFVSKQ